ncbi:MAG: RNA-splicing ligase RtcB [Nanoarchaeota archaeon]|nr:RNA-splicing ligase RtcB [Nanoarchaeota archaeon]
MEKPKPKNIKKINETTWEIPTTFKEGMRVPARIIATKPILDDMDSEVFDQLTNVATLPGIQKYAICHADGHRGYGFAIGGVAAMDFNEGVISPGGIGFDINCGMRLIKTNLTIKEVQPKIKELTDTLFKNVPAGVGCKGFVKLNNSQFDDIMSSGVKWCIENGYGWQQDLKRIEDNGTLKDANPEKVSQKAKSRGINQLGTLGSGNHYLEVQVAHAENILDKETAKKLGIVDKNQILIMVHCGSRGFGHQLATDYMKIFDNTMQKHGIKIPDRELSCAPLQSDEGQNYYSAMKCAGNMAYSNRQVILHQIRESFKKTFKQDPEKLGMELIYDCTHNIAREHKIKVDGKQKKVLVHLKGATTSLGPGHERIINTYRDLGTPIIIGGSMETGSYLLKGTKKAEEETFGTTAHGAGRRMSRTKARKLVRGDKLQKDMEQKGIYVKGVSMAGLAEEAALAYKDIDSVIDAVNKAGISDPIIKLSPISNVKG